jgi:hypothetical protein
MRPPTRMKSRSFRKNAQVRLGVFTGQEKTVTGRSLRPSRTECTFGTATEPV